jgi:hypothetical protein
VKFWIQLVLECGLFVGLMLGVWRWRLVERRGLSSRDHRFFVVFSVVALVFLCGLLAVTISGVTEMMEFNVLP